MILPQAEAEYTQSLFDAALSHVHTAHGGIAAPLVTRVTALHALFLLYRTQLKKPPVQVYVSVPRMAALVAFVEELKQAALGDALQVLRSLFTDEAFVVGAVDLTFTRKGEQEARAAANLKVVTDKAIDHLLRTRVPTTFAALGPASEAHAAAMAKVLQVEPTPGSVQKQIHNEVFRQLRRYNEKLKRTLMPPAPASTMNAAAAAAAETTVTGGGHGGATARDAAANAGPQSVRTEQETVQALHREKSLGSMPNLFSIPEELKGHFTVGNLEPEDESDADSMDGD